MQTPKARFGVATFALMAATLSALHSSTVAADEMMGLDIEPQIRAPNWLRITPGQAEMIRYTQEPRTVIVGDAEIAVASIAASDILILTGLRAGVTNVIVLDDYGVQIDQILLRVAMPGSSVTVRRALERQNLRCDPLCAPTDESGIAVVPTSPQLAPSVGTRVIDAIPEPGT